MKRIYYIICAVILVVGISSGIYYFTDYKQSKMIIPEDLVLQTYKGEDYAFKDLTPKVRLIEFMYTQCPDICPSTTHQMKQLRDQLAEENVFGDKVEFITVTFDPVRDTPEILASYAKTFQMDKTDGWYLLTGTKEEVKVLADTFEFYGRQNGRSQLSFPTIIAAGKNSTCLHYPSQNDVLRDGDVILFRFNV